MKKTLGIAAVASFGLTAAAMADVSIDVAEFTLAGGEEATFNLGNYSGVTGFSFVGTVSGMQPGTAGSWASDLRLFFDDAGSGYNIGGFSGVTNEWDFQGSGSGDNGTYASGPHMVWDGSPIDGDFVVRFRNDYDSDFADVMTWSDVTITLHGAVPAPGALALLGLAGLAGVSRRRRN